MAHDLRAKRQITDVVFADPEWELVRLGTREELLGGREGVVDLLQWHAVIGHDEESGVLASAGNGTRQRRRRPRLASEIGADIQHGNAALGQGLGNVCTVCGTEVCCKTHDISVQPKSAIRGATSSASNRRLS